MSWHFSVVNSPKSAAVETFKIALVNCKPAPHDGRLINAVEALLDTVVENSVVTITTHGYQNSDKSGGAMVSIQYGS